MRCAWRIAVLVALAAPACSKDEQGSSSLPPAAATLTMFEAWTAAQAAMRLSPDHLPARAEALVAEGDPVAIFEFVRDAIATYPPSTNGFGSAVGAQRWGARGTLRGGAGTPREKAELLVDLYRRASFEAEVVQGTADPARLSGQSVLLRNPAPPFSPPISPAEAQAWSVALGYPSPPARTGIDPQGTAAQALAAAIIAQMPNTLTAPFDFTLTTIPLVRVRIAGVWEYANPIAPTAAFGDPVTTGTPTPTGGAFVPQTVFVRLQAARADAPYDRFTLVEQTFAANDVVGRRIQIAFPPPASLDTLLGMRVQDIETLVPVLSVVGPDMTPADRDRLATVGNMFSLGGDVYTRLVGGGLAVGNDTVYSPNTDPAYLATVTAVTSRVSGAAFPRVALVVRATNAAGVNVPRLGPSAFSVSEEGAPVSFSLTRNEAPPPRVILLFDLSTSIPAEFLGVNAAATADSIVQGLYSGYPSARVRVAVINFGASFVSGTWAATLSEAQAQAQALSARSGGSEIWEALYDVESLDPTVIVMVTDGDATDAPLPRYESALATGAPVLSIAVGTPAQTTLDRIAALSHGRTVPATASAEAVAAALAEIDARSVEDYVLSYQAQPGLPVTRNVNVTVNSRAATGSYDVPATPAVPNALSGLYLTLGVSGRNHTAPVAGFALGFSTAFPTITQAMLDDVRALLLGRISVAVEGAAPPASVVLDEWIGEKLSLEPFYAAVAAADETAIKAALAPGFSRTPSKLPLANPPLWNAWSASALTFETGPRVAAVLQKVSGSTPSTRLLHLFPLGRWATAANDPRVAWERTVAATAGLAVVEAGLMAGTSTLEALAGTTLSVVPAGQADTQAGLTAEQRLHWAALEASFNAEYTLLVPVAPGPFWAVHENTGTLIGVLPDGTGGGAEDVCSTYDLSNSYLDALGMLGNLGGPAMGGWLVLAQWEVENLTMATLVIGYDAEARPMTNLAEDLACNALDEHLGDVLPEYGEYGKVQGALEAAGVDTGLPSLCGGGSDLCQ